MGLNQLLALALSASTVAAQHLVPRNESVSPHFGAVSKYIESIRDDLWSINKEIHDNPELGFEEEKAHDLLTTYLESQDGWKVTRSVHNFTTAFAAVFEGTGDGPVVSFNAEYGASNILQGGEAVWHFSMANNPRCSTRAWPCVRTQPHRNIFPGGCPGHG